MVKVNSIEDLKKLIEWCKLEKVSYLKVGDVEFNISNIGLVEDFGETKTAENTKELQLKGTDTWSDENLKDDDEDLLFYSAT